jgi:hypothetical protein
MAAILAAISEVGEKLEEQGKTLSEKLEEQGKTLSEKLEEQGKTLSEQGKTLAVLQAELKEHSESFSVVSPTGPQYEAFIDGQISELLERYCGLRDAGGRRGIPVSDPASGGQQWDGRFSVLLLPGWTAPAPVLQFTVYGSFTAFQRPPLGSMAPRHISPTKSFPPAHYFAIMEYTAHSEWWRDIYDDKHKVIRNNLLSRLEKRLAITLQRFKAAGNPQQSTILDAVAAVGVVSDVDNKSNVDNVMGGGSHCPHPLLRDMMQAGRFVHFTVLAAMQGRQLPASSSPVAGSP